MRIASLVIAGLVWAVTPATTLAADGKWKWTSSPQADGTHCWMGIDHKGRKLTVHATSGMGNFIGIVSPKLGNMAAREEGTLTFAGGTPRPQQYTLVWRKGNDKDTTYVANGINEEGVVSLLKGFVMADSFSDEVSVAIGSSGDLRFPATGADQAAQGFAGCVDQL